MPNGNMPFARGDESNRRQLYKSLINQYCKDEIGRQVWQGYGEKLDALNYDEIESLMRTIFSQGACIDFANAVFELTSWPIYEFQWGEATRDDPNECDKLDGIHRAVKHPSGRFIDATGWIDKESAFKTLGAEERSYQWLGEVDYGATVFDGVDYEHVKEAAKSLMPVGSLATEVLGDNRSLKAIVDSLVRSWGGDGIEPQEINNGLCADFANAIVELYPSANIVGVYDSSDIEFCPGTHSSEFEASVKKDGVGHTAVFAEGLFYDAEATCGVSSFEDLPINQRAIRESILDDMDLSGIELQDPTTQHTYGR